MLEPSVRGALCSVGSGAPLPLQTSWDPDGSLIVFVGRLSRREHVQRTASEWIRAVSIHLFSNMLCLVWAMWGLFDKGRTILIEFAGSTAVHPGGRARALPGGSAGRQETARAWPFILAKITKSRVLLPP